MHVLAAILALVAGAGDPGTVGETPIAPAGSQAATLPVDEAIWRWRGSLATGVAGKLGGMRLERGERNSRVLLYFGGQADGSWTERYRQAARLRLRLFTGGEDALYAPSEGDAEAAYMVGRPELRFVVARVEVGRYPTLGMEALAQASTLPCFEGALSLAGDRMRLHYFVSPVEGAWVHYYGGAHLRHRAGWASESNRPVAASAGRLRYTLALPAPLLLSLQADFVKMWRRADLFLSAEGSLGYAVLQRSAVLNLLARWSGYTRRGVAPGTSEREGEAVLLAAVTLML